MGSQQTGGKRDLQSTWIRPVAKVHLGWVVVTVLATGPSSWGMPDDECTELRAAAQPCRVTAFDGITMIELSAVVEGADGGRYRLDYSDVSDQGAHTLNQSLTVDKDGEAIMTLDMHVTDTIREPISIATLTYAASLTGAALVTAEVLAGKIFGQVDGRPFGPVALSPLPDSDTLFTGRKPPATLSMPASTARALRCLERAMGNEARSCEAGCATGNAAAAIDCCMAAAPMDCLLCSVAVVEAKVACLEMPDGSTSEQDAKPRSHEGDDLPIPVLLQSALFR